MKTILSILICLLSLTVVAQTTKTQTAPKAGAPKAAVPKKEATCYDEWYALFKERGAKPLTDGVHEVIISLRNEYNYAECFLGKVELKEGRVISKVQIQKVDGTYEEYDKKVNPVYQNADGVIKDELRGITNGMSETFTLTDGEKIRLFFFKSLADKAKANQKAPPASALVKN